MDVHLTLVSQSRMLLRLAGDFAKGLDCATEDESDAELRIVWSDADDRLLQLLEYIALSVREPASSSQSRYAG